MEWNALTTSKIADINLKTLIWGDDFLGIICWIIKRSSIGSDGDDFTMIWWK